MKESNIVTGIDGNRWIKTYRSKTDFPVTLPILPIPLAILSEFKNHPKINGTNKLLPSISNQKLNTYLKEIADVCRIKKRLTFHIARHTFATTVALSNGVPIESLSKMLGHSKITTTQIYAKVVEKKISQDMKKLHKVLQRENLK